MKTKVLIIGGVAGGASAATRLRRLDETLEIVILERGGYISYANCGLPYYVGDVLERDALMLQTPETMKAKYDIDVRVNNEALKIDRNAKTVLVKNLITGEEYQESYDVLLLATGSSPLRPPIPGIDSSGIFTVWTIPDTDRIKKYIKDNKSKRAAIIGGGFIGLEMAENLHAIGCDVTVIEMLDQVMAPVDFEMAQLIHENMRMNNIKLELNNGVQKFDHKDGVTTILLQNGATVEADIVILAIGVRPNSSLAKECGLELNERGGIIVDDYMKTSDPNIYAVGDVIEVEGFVLKNRTMIPLAGPANKQARICANNIAIELGSFSGDLQKYNGTQGTSVAQVFDLTVATTGVNEKTLKSMGMELNKDYFVALINHHSHAGYYPGATALTLKLLFDKEGKILGSQIIGQEGVDKRIDVIATTQRIGGTVHDLAELELAYAPPYSSAKDPVNVLGFVADNILKGLASYAAWDDLEISEQTDNKDVTILDVNEDVERMVFCIPNSHSIPLGQLRQHLNELDKAKLIISCCSSGLRSYNAARILQNSGFKNVKSYPCGTSFYKSVFHDKLSENDKTPQSMNSSSDPSIDNEVNSSLEDEDYTANHKPNVQNTEPIKITVKQTLDCSGLQCPGPIMRVFQTINDMADGDILQVSATDMGFARDIETWCKRTGNTLLKAERKGKETVVFIQKGLGDTELESDTAAQSVCSTGFALPQGKSIIVFSGDLDKVLASFIIANGAAAMGRPVTMFFTFWGLNALRKNEKQKVKKPLIDSMFGTMMPRGASRLGLSKMNMGGIGTAMMKKVMRDKNVDTLEDLMKKAMENGIRIVACTMSMDVMGLKPEELIDGIEYAGVADYLGDAEESNVNLFI
ncbi:MAG TPA: FAD-dependent oxidoreductase [Clostridiales bacterium]|nr:FAD-dependent oxidoreductase [Clostridiales bacterium]